MLDITLSTEFTPGTNLKGEVAGANWLFLLPRMDLDLVVCLGMPTPAGLVALARMTGEVAVCAAGPERERLAALAKQYGLANVRVLTGTLGLNAGSVALVLIAGAAELARFGEDAAAVAELRRMLRPGGLVYSEQPGLLAGKRERAAVQRLAEAVGAPQRFWLTPLSGEMHTAIPERDHATTSYFLRYGLTSRSVNLATLKRAVRARANGPGQPHAEAAGPAVASAVRPKRGLKAQVQRAARTTLVSVYNQVQHAFDGAEQRLNRSAMLGDLTRRYGLLINREHGERAGAPPRYLREIAQAAGVPIEQYRWGLSARGEYSSRKVLVFLFDRQSEQPEYIVKLTRDPALNPRLENEYRALRLLAEKGIGDGQTLPQAVFLGHHNRLAVVGETIVDGVPFEQRSNGTPACVFMRNAADWLTDMSVATIEREAATSAQAAAALGRLFERFAQIYPLSPEHRQFMAGQLGALAERAGAFPLVFQHGDPGTWNIWVTPAGRTAFLDWEAAEARGMPLWDLLYFIRTYGAWAARTTASGDITKGFAEQFLTNSPFNRLLAEATGRYCERVGLPTELIEPLFYTCWMHRGLKEATRLTPAQLARGHYFNVLRASIDGRAALQPLFRAGAHILS
ncbi:MAG: phosphotransferase [Kouleothrix sp.]|jgi:SAM-dependent methyltransferase|nr:phosphotransferase [Kouleothrix sp.]